MDTMGERIRKIRKKNHLTQKEFSEKLCISRPFVSNIENNQDIPSRPVIRLICVLFKVDENWLINGID